MSSGSRSASSLCSAHESKWIRNRSSDASICSSIRGTGSPSTLRQLGDVRTLIAVLRRVLPAPDRLDRGAEAIHLRAGVVVVVLALDRVARVREDARDRVAVGPVPSRCDGDRPGRVRGHHLHLHPLGGIREAAAVGLPRLEDLRAAPRRTTRARARGSRSPGRRPRPARRASSAVACSASSSAISRGGRFRCGASWSAAFVAKSPCSGLGGPLELGARAPSREPLERS